MMSADDEGAMRCVLVTGATGLIGRAIALHLAQLGWRLVVTSRSAAKAKVLATELGSNALGIGLDLSQDRAAALCVTELAEKGVRITHLVNNARSLTSLRVGADGISDPEDFQQEYLIDVVQPYLLTMNLHRDSRHGLRGVVNIGSQYGEIAMNRNLYGGDESRMPIQYSAAKAALHHLTRELACRLAPVVRVNCVAFGGFAGRSPEDFSQLYASMLPAGRMLAPTEAGPPVSFLLDDASSSVTGHVIRADGGWSIW